MTTASDTDTWPRNGDAAGVDDVARLGAGTGVIMVRRPPVSSWPPSMGNLNIEIKSLPTSTRSAVDGVVRERILRRGLEVSGTHQHRPNLQNPRRAPTTDEASPLLACVWLSVQPEIG